MKSGAPEKKMVHVYHRSMYVSLVLAGFVRLSALAVVFGQHLRGLCLPTLGFRFANRCRIVDTYSLVCRKRHFVLSRRFFCFPLTPLQLKIRFWGEIT